MLQSIMLWSYTCSQICVIAGKIVSDVVTYKNQRGIPCCKFLLLNEDYHAVTSIGTNAHSTSKYLKKNQYCMVIGYLGNPRTLSPQRKFYICAERIIAVDAPANNINFASVAGWISSTPKLTQKNVSFNVKTALWHGAIPKDADDIRSKKLRNKRPNFAPGYFWSYRTTPVKIPLTSLSRILKTDDKIAVAGRLKSVKHNDIYQSFILSEHEPNVNIYNTK